MALDVHTLVQNAHHIDARVGRAVEDDVRAAWIFPIARADGICGPTEARTRREKLQRGLNPPDVPLSLVRAPAADGVVPDVGKVGRRTRRENERQLLRFGPFALDEGVEIEGLRGAASFALEQRAAKRFEPGLVLFKQPQRSAHDLARRAVAALRELSVDEPGKVVT